MPPPGAFNSNQERRIHDLSCFLKSLGRHQTTGDEKEPADYTDRFYKVVLINLIHTAIL